MDQLVLALSNGMVALQQLFIGGLFYQVCTAPCQHRAYL